MDPVHISDRLIERCKAGDRRAQSELYQNYVNAMFNISTRMLVRREDAEDAVQEAFIDAFRNIAQFEGKATIGAWIKRITINKCINIAQRRKFAFEAIEEHQPRVPPLMQADEREITPDMIHRAIKQLPDGCRVVFTLNQLEGYDHGEIASILNVSESTSKSQLHRARQLLQDMLKKPSHVG